MRFTQSILLLGLLPGTLAFTNSFSLGSSNRVAQRGINERDNKRITELYNTGSENSRRDILKTLLGGGVVAGSSLLIPNTVWAEGESPDGMNVNDFLKSGMVSQPMGVSGQAGKSRPETGVVLRDGSEVSREKRTGQVSAEIVVGPSDNLASVLVGFNSPWPLATGTVFDVECRDSKTGDGAFLLVAGGSSISGKSIGDIPEKVFTDQLFRPDGRFSFYGQPTDIKVKKNSRFDESGKYRFFDLSFSNLSQSTMTEIPRNALLVATIPEGTNNVVMLVGSATANRWKKGSKEDVTKTVESFRVLPAPKTGLKVRAKDRNAYSKLEDE